MLLELTKLTPFYVSQVVYWHLAYIPTSQPGLWTAFIKCLPVATLAFYLATCRYNGHSVIRNLFFGMLFSNAGDFCLVYKEYFILGIVCFAIAHVFFIIAFGFKVSFLPLTIDTLLYNLCNFDFFFLINLAFEALDPVANCPNSCLRLEPVIA